MEKNKEFKTLKIWLHKNINILHVQYSLSESIVPFDNVNNLSLLTQVHTLTSLVTTHVTLFCSYEYSIFLRDNMNNFVLLTQVQELILWQCGSTLLMSEDTLKIICYSYVHSIITYGIIFWGNSPHNTDICKIQKWIIRIMTKSSSRDSCRHLFKQLEILPLQSQYIFSVLLFVVKNKDLYSTNQEIHNINTRCNINWHLPVCNLTLFQKGACFSGINLFKHLPPKIKSLSNEIKLFKPTLKRFLNTHSFYPGSAYTSYQNVKCNMLSYSV